MLQIKCHIVDWINIVAQWPFLNVTNQPNWNNDSGNMYVSKYPLSIHLKLLTI